MKDYTKAEAAFRESLVLDSSDVPANLNLGMSLAFQGKYDEAIPYFEKGLEYGNDTERALASKNLKELYAEKEEWEKKL